MLRCIEDYFARRATIRTLGKSVSPEGIDKILKGDFETPPPEWRNIEIVLVLLSTITDEDMLKNYRSVVTLAKQNDYFIESFAGALVYLINGVFPFQEENTVSPAELAKQIHQEIDIDARLIYGSGTALVGSIGGEGYYNYTAVLPHLPQALAHLCNLPEGGCEEFKPE
jgi:hypothetical protein